MSHRLNWKTLYHVINCSNIRWKTIWFTNILNILDIIVCFVSQNLVSRSSNVGMRDFWRKYFNIQHWISQIGTSCRTLFTDHNFSTACSPLGLIYFWCNILLTGQNIHTVNSTRPCNLFHPRIKILTKPPPQQSTPARSLLNRRESCCRTKQCSGGGSPRWRFENSRSPN